MIMTIKTQRIRVNRLVNTLRRYPNGREISLAITQAQQCRQWLGKVLGYLGEKHPYPESTNPDSPVIEPEVDSTTDLIMELEDLRNLDRVSSIKACRLWCDEIEKGATGLKELYEVAAMDADDPTYTLYTMQAFGCLMQCKMWLGEELGNLRNRDERIHESITSPPTMK